MMRMVPIVGIALVLTVAMSGRAQGNGSSGVIAGAGANMNFNDPTSGFFGNVMVGRNNNPPGTVTTGASVYVSGVSGNNLVEVFGGGSIPNEDMQGDGTGQITVSIPDVTALPNFSITICTTPIGVGNSTCSAQSGSVDVTCAKNGFSSSADTFNTRQIFNSFTSRQQGTSTTDSCSSSGSIVGYSFATNFSGGGLGDFHINSFSNSKN